MLCYYNPFDQYFRVIYRITINTQTHTLTLFKDNSVYKTYPVAVGKPSSPTPRGTFRIINRAVNPGGPFGVRWLGLNAPNGDYGIHGTNNPSSIGKNISNGCIRMFNSDVLELSSLVSIGTVVPLLFNKVNSLPLRYLLNSSYTELFSGSPINIQAL